ncbi:hypothetical protein niasHT_026350 [Heterodera trifolii]|uniref:Uncharacterized protein n=1 Tax=Heterodera trifolii TaxID=157864 RepID=A0ABD2K1N7_9BILA
MLLRKRRAENLDFLSRLCLRTLHLKGDRNVHFSAAALSNYGANRTYAYRGLLSITVEQHLFTRHRVRLRHPFLPCVVQAGGNNHCYFYPLELVRVCQSPSSGPNNDNNNNNNNNNNNDNVDESTGESATLVGSSSSASEAF